MSDQLGIGSRVRLPEHGEGVICGDDGSKYRISFPKDGIMNINKTYPGIEVIEEVTNAGDMVSIYDIEDRLESILREWNDIQEMVPLGDRWKGGTMILQPADDSLQAKEIPIETFFHKIVMLRDRLRVLEQNINSSKKLDDEDKVNLQQYVTRCYGSLTSFNVLFKLSIDGFKGEGKK